MADWPNSGQLPQPIGSDSFDPEMDMIGYSSILESEELSHYSQATQDIFQHAQDPFQLPHEVQAQGFQPQHDFQSPGAHDQGGQPYRDPVNQDIQQHHALQLQLQDNPAFQDLAFQEAQQNLGVQPQVALQAQYPQQTVTGPGADIMNTFFTGSGAWRPPVPCTNCRRKRLQCVILKTAPGNPNPVSSCSSCAALFLQCSLAERKKRDHSAFETSLPVIGQLHGVSEENDASVGDTDIGSDPMPIHLVSQVFDNISQEEVQSMAAASAHGQTVEEYLPEAAQSTSNAPRHTPKKASARMVKKTRALRLWFDRNMARPFPDESEKEALCLESGLTRTQVDNYFINRRRRMKKSMSTQAKQGYFPLGSPMPQRSPSDMSPLERWRSSPPDQEALCPDTLQDMLHRLQHEPSGTGKGGVGAGVEAQGSRELSSASTSQGSVYSINNNPAWYDASSNSGSSAYSFRSANTLGLFSPVEEFDAGEAKKGTLFFCTFCHRQFKKKSDWERHESAIHLPELNSWTCSVASQSEGSHLVWDVGQSHPCCFYCGHENPTAEHTRSHELESCAERPVQERSFARKDHLWQHLQKFHGCRKWKGLSLEVCSVHRKIEKVRSQCGFCGLWMGTWTERSTHIPAHFRSGLTMAEWRGNAGVHAVG